MQHHIFVQQSQRKRSIVTLFARIGPIWAIKGSRVRYLWHFSQKGRLRA